MAMGSNANNQMDQHLSTSGRAWGEPVRPAAPPARGERGATMMFVLMAMLLVGAVTVSAMQVIGADVGGGVEGMQADQVFNIAQAGAHYVIGKMQLAGTLPSYAGETVTVVNGSTTLGTAVVTVSCITTGLAPTSTGCATNDVYRRVISVGSLPVSGPSRTVVAVIQGTAGAGGGGWTTAVCGLNTVNSYTASGETTTINGDIASNGSVNLNPNPAAVGEGSILGTVNVKSGTGYTGAILAKTTASCTSPNCTHAGTLSGSAANAGCAAPTIPAPGYVPGSGTTTVGSGTTLTINCSSGTCPTAYGDVILPAGPTASSYTVLAIKAPASGTAVLQMNSLTMHEWTRLVVESSAGGAPAGNIDLRLGKTTTTALDIGPYKNSGFDSHFGVLPSDTDASPQPLPQAKTLTVWVNSDGTSPTVSTNHAPNLACSQSSSTITTLPDCAVWLSHNTGNATIIAANGTAMIDDASENNLTVPMKGAILAKEVDFMGNTAFTQDTTGLSTLSFPPATASNFKQVMSWKDQ